MKKFILILFIAALSLPFTVKAQGCMESTSSTGGPQIIGYIQPEFRASFNGDDALGNTQNDYTFAFRRARIGLTGSIPYDFSYYVMGEFSSFQNGPYLLDAFITYNRLKPWLKVSIGQFKRQFGLELTTPCQDLYTVDRSKIVSEALTPFRDLGLMVSGSTGAKKLFGLQKENILSYAISLTNGTGMNTLDIDRYKDFTGRITFAPYDWISAGASYQYGKKVNADPTVTAADVRSRWGADLSLKKYNFVVQAEYLKATDKGSKLVGGGCGSTPELVAGNFYSNGMYAMVGYSTPWKLMPVVKFETYDPNNDVEDIDAHEYRQSSVIFGLNYYPNDWSRVQLNYFYNTETSSGSDITKYNEFPNDAFILQIQVKLN
ncbi:MAG TPA: porin [Bacteroidales bacterium]|nr:porin [Bacteroidales bacterium]